MKNGVEHKRGSFTPWFWSYRLAAKLEAAVVVCVFAGVVAIMAFLFQMPGPLVVHVQDDRREPIKNARVRCTSPDAQTSHVGMTDVFGEAKWPGLAKGPWRCDVSAPDLYHAPVQTGFATVAARHPAMWTATVERPGRVIVRVIRPTGAPRAKIAVRAVCGDSAWEARTGVLDGLATLFVPHGAECRVGIVRPDLPGEGPTRQLTLSCDSEPCAGPFHPGVGQEASTVLKPTAEQWAAVRPPPDPDMP
jgi:hypothetical protein